MRYEYTTQSTTVLSAFVDIIFSTYSTPVFYYSTLCIRRHCFGYVRTHLKLNSPRFRCSAQAPTALLFQFRIALGINPGGVLNTEQMGLRFSCSVFLAGNFSTCIISLHEFIHITAVHETDLDMLFHSYFEYLSDMVASILSMFVHMGLNMLHHLCLFF